MSQETERVTLGHGNGGSLSAALLAEVIYPVFRAVQPTDAAVLAVPAGSRAVFTTDSFVVKPRSFPGGDIGHLAVNGTVNDLAMMGAEPVYLSCGLILEEGLPIDDLRQYCASMAAAAAKADVTIVTGDTKVVGRGEADGIFINTAGLGFVSPAFSLDPSWVEPGDAILVNGGLAEHGTVVMAERLGVSFNPILQSDTAPLWSAVRALLAAGITPRVMRDITRGGLASVLNELAAGQSVDYQLREDAIPIDPRVRRACEIWGFDPLQVASEGRMALVVPSAQAAASVDILRQEQGFSQAAVVGEVSRGSGRVQLQTRAGGVRAVKSLAGELLPRIC